MRRARAHSSFCSQVILVNVHFVSVHYTAAENRKNSLKPPISGLKVIKGY